MAATRKEKEEELKIYSAPGSSLQTPEEHQHDQSVQPQKQENTEVSIGGLRETDLDKMRDTLDGGREE